MVERRPEGLGVCHLTRGPPTRHPYIFARLNIKVTRLTFIKRLTFAD